MTHRFLSMFRLGQKLPAFDQDTIKREPGFFSSRVSYAHAHGGPITRAFLEAVVTANDLEANGASGYVFDSRVHMLMPGWYPCIPGFHHDDVPRSRADGQPNYETPEYRSQHVMALANGDIAPTEFAVGSIELESVPLGAGPIYKHWHVAVDEACNTGAMERVPAPSDQLIYFDCDAFHQGVQAVGGGFRWFGRLSWNTQRTYADEIRNQTQVYLPLPMEGW